MKKILLAFSFLALQNISAQDVTIMSYNIRLDVESDGENKWANRNDFLTDQVKFYAPDFMGVQEALPHQMQFIEENLPNYEFIGIGREGQSKGEFSAIFFNAKKFKMLEQNTFWLSETPEKISKGWDAAYNRICTYGLFQNKKTKQKFWVFNTHFDHVGDVARVESSKLILKKINEINAKKLPVLLTGDFNLKEETAPIKEMLVGLDLAKNKSLTKPFGPDGTFSGFQFNKPVKDRIDHIFVSKKGIKVLKFATLSDSKDCRYPSDHLPVYAEIDLE